VTDEATPTTETTPTPQAGAPETAEPPLPAPAATPTTGSGKAQFIWGTGRRKSSVARVRIKSGEGKFIVNNKDVNAYFCVEDHRQTVHAPLRATDTGKSFDVLVNVCGGGITGQAGAISLGLSRALSKVDPEIEAKLRDKRLMTRDPRRVERKKYGQSGARKRFQFSKR
jgi:small subunit ribosomal protein S9